MKCQKCGSLNLTASRCFGPRDASVYQVNCLDCGTTCKKIRSSFNGRSVISSTEDWSNVKSIDPPRF